MRDDVAASTRDDNDDAVADSIQSKYRKQQQHLGYARLMISNLLFSPKKQKKKNINKQINVLYVHNKAINKEETDETFSFLLSF